MGHLEKRCPTRFNENFVNLGMEFPYGEWLKAGKIGEVANLPLQPLPTPATGQRLPTTRGLQTFGFGIRELKKTANGKENDPLMSGGVQFEFGGADSLGSSSSHNGLKRKAINVSTRMNKKSTNVEIRHEIDERPLKKTQIGALGDLVVVPYELLILELQGSRGSPDNSHTRRHNPNKKPRTSLPIGD